MTAAFILTLEVDDVSPDALALEASYVADTLTQNGVAVVTVEPWSRPSTTQPSLVDIANALPQNLFASDANPVP